MIYNLAPDTAEKIKHILKRIVRHFQARVSQKLFAVKLTRILSLGIIILPEWADETISDRDRFQRLLNEFEFTDKATVDAALEAISREFRNFYHPIWELDGNGWYPLGSIYAEIRDLEAHIHQEKACA